LPVKKSFTSEDTEGTEKNKAGLRVRKTAGQPPTPPRPLPPLFKPNLLSQSMERGHTYLPNRSVPSVTPW